MDQLSDLISNYTQHLGYDSVILSNICQNMLHHKHVGVHIEFDNYNEPCSDSKLLSEIKTYLLLPKVLVPIVIDYLSDVIRIIFTNYIHNKYLMMYKFKSHVYNFIIEINNSFFSIYNSDVDSHDYMKFWVKSINFSEKCSIFLLEQAKHNIHNDIESLRNIFNKQMYFAQIINMPIFIQIMYPMLVVQKHMTKLDTS